jgi:hypothetical protein
MSSNASSPGRIAAPAADVVAELATAIEEYAATASDPAATARPDLAGRLAALWAMLTDADPELAVLAARYEGK